MKKKIIASILVFAVIAGVVGLNVAARNKKKFTQIKTAKVTKGDVKSYLSTTATIKSKNSKDYYGPQAKVKSVNVKVGDKVKKGDVLINYDVQDLSAAVSQAQISYDNALSTKRDLINQNNINSAKISDLKLDSQINDYTSKLNDINNKINDINNQIANTSDQAVISKLQAQLNQQGTGLLSQRDSLQGTLNQLKNSKYALAPISDEKVKQADNAIALAQVNLDTAKENLAKNVDNITAEFDGVVTSLNAVAGAMSSAAQPAVSVQDVDNLKGVVLVDKFNASKIQAGQEAVIKYGDKEYNGKVSFIAPSAVTSVSSTGQDTTLEVDVDITNPSQELKIGFDADIDILLGQVNDVIKVPAESIKTDKTGRNYVYVVQNNKAIEKSVKLGIQSDTDAEIADGLNVGDKVILNPSASIKNGSLVRENLGGK